jgi:hypothetical protein
MNSHDTEHYKNDLKTFSQQKTHTTLTKSQRINTANSNDANRTSDFTAIMT